MTDWYVYSNYKRVRLSLLVNASANSGGSQTQHVLLSSQIQGAVVCDATHCQV